MKRFEKEKLIKAIGKDAYEVGKKVGSRLCPYDEAFTIREMMEETGRCKHCFVPQCPLNTLDITRKDIYCD